MMLGYMHTHRIVDDGHETLLSKYNIYRFYIAHIIIIYIIYRSASLNVPSRHVCDTHTHTHTHTQVFNDDCASGLWGPIGTHCKHRTNVIFMRT